MWQRPRGRHAQVNASAGTSHQRQSEYGVSTQLFDALGSNQCSACSAAIL